MSIIETVNISKRFGEVQAVDNLSFEVQPGEIFGLLGPNGAGKTTSIRMILDIFKPDEGEIRILGGPMTDEKKNRIGYLPEERGLYQEIPLERCLIILATLKGMDESHAASKLMEYSISIGGGNPVLLENLAMKIENGELIISDIEDKCK